jgi:hypothetical protein
VRTTDALVGDVLDAPADVLISTANPFRAIPTYIHKIALKV